MTKHDTDTPRVRVAPTTPTLQRRNLGYQYDPLAGEWAFMCGACGHELFAPTKTHLRRSHLIHTTKYCLGGW